MRVLDSDKGWRSVPGIGLRVTESEMAEKRGEKRERTSEQAVLFGNGAASMVQVALE